MENRFFISAISVIRGQNFLLFFSRSFAGKNSSSHKNTVRNCKAIANRTFEFQI